MARYSLVVHSGGQTGVDRAALDTALECGVAVGGWCPRDRRAEDGSIPVRYPLRETLSDAYAQRTAWNVRDTDATLVITQGMPDTGTALTLDVAERERKPTFVLDLAAEYDVTAIVAWLRANDVAVLNVAGPRESSAPGVYHAARAFLTDLLRALDY